MADAQVLLLFGAMAGFQAKHLLCDHVLQTRYQVANKGYYGRSGGLWPAVAEGPLCWAIAVSGIMAADDKRRRRWKTPPPRLSPLAPCSPTPAPANVRNRTIFDSIRRKFPQKNFLVNSYT